MASSCSGNKATPPLGPLGISCAGLCAFIDAHGGRGEFASLTTGDVKTTFVLPATASDRCAYVDIIVAGIDIDGTALVAPATAFVSHAYFYPFLDVVDAIGAWEAARPPGCPCTYFYFDLLVVNQHGQSAVVPFETLRDEFGGGVTAAGRTLLVLDEGATAMERLWCVFEVATTTELGVPLEVIMVRASLCCGRLGSYFRL